MTWCIFPSFYDIVFVTSTCGHLTIWFESCVRESVLCLLSLYDLLFLAVYTCKDPQHFIARNQNCHYALLQDPRRPASQCKVPKNNRRRVRLNISLSLSLSLHLHTNVLPEEGLGADNAPGHTEGSAPGEKPVASDSGSTGVGVRAGQNTTGEKGINEPIVDSAPTSGKCEYEVLGWREGIVDVEATMSIEAFLKAVVRNT